MTFLLIHTFRSAPPSAYSSRSQMRRRSSARRPGHSSHWARGKLTRHRSYQRYKQHVHPYRSCRPCRSCRFLYMTQIHLFLWHVPSQVPFAACLERLSGDELLEDYSSAALGGKRTQATKSTRLASFPPYLVLALRRYYIGEGWVPKKLVRRKRRAFNTFIYQNNLVIKVVACGMDV